MSQSNATTDTATKTNSKPGIGLRTLQAINRAVQVVSLFFLGEWALYGILRCPFIVPFVSCQNCPVITCPGRVANTFWGVWAVWLSVGLLAGRTFCGWICPGGLLNRILSWNPFKINLHEDASADFDKAKYIVLFLALAGWFILQQPRINVPIRVEGEFWQAVGLTFDFAFPAWLFRAYFVLAILALSLFISFAWCRFACPAGAALEIFRPTAIFRVWKTNACNNCDKCRHVCGMNTRPDEHNCTNCGDCLESCAVNAIRIGIKKD